MHPGRRHLVHPIGGSATRGARPLIRATTVIWLWLLCCGGLLPVADSPAVHLSAAWPGASILDVESTLTTPLELRLHGVPDVVRVASVTRGGVVDLQVDFKPGTDTWDARQRVLATISGFDGPPESSSPVLLWAGPDDPRDGRVFLTSEMLSPDEMVVLADDLRRDLLTIHGVADVRLVGAVHHRIAVDVDTARLSTFGLSIADIWESLRQSEVHVPGLDRGLSAAPPSLDDITATAVVFTEAGGPVTIGDVATVRTDPVFDSRISVNGRSGLLLEWWRPGAGLPGADPVDLHDAVRSFVARSPGMAEVIVLPVDGYRQTVTAQNLDVTELDALATGLMAGTLITQWRSDGSRLTLITESEEEWRRFRRLAADSPLGLRMGGDLQVRLIGPDMHDLAALSTKLSADLAQVVGVMAVYPELREIPTQSIVIDRTKLAGLGIQTAAVHQAIAAATIGIVAGTGPDGADIVVRSSPGGMDSVVVAAATGQLVPLTAFADVRVEGALASIHRVDMQRSLPIAVLAADPNGLEALREATRQVIAEFALPAGYAVEIR